MHEGTSSFLKLFSCLVSGAGLIWYIDHNYGANYVMVSLVIVAGTVFFIGGALLSHSIQKSTLGEVTKFAAKDAVTDRYRMQSLREVTKADGYYAKADASLKVLDAKAQQKLLAQKEQPLADDQTFWQSQDTVDLDQEWN